MHTDTLIPVYTIIIFSVLIISLIFKRIRIPFVVGYLLIGIFIGPTGIGFIEDPEHIGQFEIIGLVFLLFFVGMEINMETLLKSWKIPILGTVLQIILTVGIVFILGTILNWNIARVILLGFAISLSSTAVIIKLLMEWNMSETHVGKNVIGVLLVQDIALIPMVIILDLIQGKSMMVKDLLLQVSGGILLIIFIIIQLRKKEIHLPFMSYFKAHKELQIFAALAICFGMVMVSEFFRFSPYLGAFIAGIYVRSTKETEWIHVSLEPFYVFFVAIFFVSVGMMLDLNFLTENWLVILMFVGLVFIFNTGVNTIMMRLLGEPWRESLFGGALLSQVGEFSFIIVAVGEQSKILSSYTYQVILALITLTLILSPFWIGLFRLLTGSRISVHK